VAATDRPNILLIFVDQQRYDTLGLHGHATCRTPALDRLARRGVDFSHAYTCCGLCSPARSSVMTGLYPHNHGVLTNTHDGQSLRQLDPAIPTFAQALQGAGYHTSYVGKVHLSYPESTPAPYGFHEWHRPYHQYLRENGLEAGETVPPFYGPERSSFRNPFAATYDGPIESDREYWRAEEGRRILGERAQDYDENGTPFFLRIDLPGPHLPFIIPAPFSSLYDPADVPEPPEFDDSFERKPWMHAQMPRYWGVDGTEWSFWQPIVAKYWGFVTMLDMLIGRVLDRLDELGLAESTAVFYTTDHGDTCGSRRMFDKGYCMYEELYHIPFIASWPGVWEEGRACAEFANNLDLMPTFLELAGIEPPAGIDARSLAPLLAGRTPEDWPSDAYAEFNGMQWGLYSQRMLVTDRHKLIFNATDTDELYDLQEDPHELRNVLDAPGYADAQRAMYLRLFQRMQATGDPICDDLWWPKYEAVRQDIDFARELTYGHKS